jgi:geranylgeranyl diphosphate synthase type I
MDFESTLKKYKKIIDNELELFLNNKTKEAKNPFLKLNYSFIKEFVLAGGKRLRPIALIMAYNAVNGNDEQSVYTPSLSVELMHNSTLVHDDIMDEDDLRRNKPTVHKNLKEWFLKNHDEIENKSPLFNNASSRFGVSNAILSGDILLSLGHSALSASKNENSKKALSIYNNAYNVIVDGQIIDISTSLNNISEKDYFDMITKKTSALFKASIEIGAILGKASQEKINNLSDYAFNIAIAFQLKDDIMDISPEMEKGHSLGSDIKKGKKTLLIIKALESANEEEKNKILNILGKEDASLHEINSVIDILKSTGAVDYADKVAREKIKSAKEFLKKAELSKEYSAFFEKLADFVVKREY